MDETLKKKPEPDDPMELRGVACDGDPDFMVDCLIEEYAWMGWRAQDIMGLFESPSYPVLHGLYRTQGAESIRHRVEVVIQRFGGFRFQTTERPAEHELVQIETPTEGEQEL